MKVYVVMSLSIDGGGKGLDGIDMDDMEVFCSLSAAKDYAGKQAAEHKTGENFFLSVPEDIDDTDSQYMNGVARYKDDEDSVTFISLVLPKEIKGSPLEALAEQAE